MADLSKIVCLEQDCRHGAEQTGGSGSGNDTYTKAEIDSKDATVKAIADKAQSTATSAATAASNAQSTANAAQSTASSAASAAADAQSVNHTQDRQIADLQKAAHTHSNKDIIDKIEQPFTTADQAKLNSLKNYEHPTHKANSKGFYKFASDDLGHVSETEAVTKKDITDLGIPESNTTYTISRNTIFDDFITLTDSNGKKVTANIDPIVTPTNPPASGTTAVKIFNSGLLYSYCNSASTKQGKSENIYCIRDIEVYAGDTFGSRIIFYDIGFRGEFRLSQKSKFYVHKDEVLTSDLAGIVYFPNKSGTLAIDEDIPYTDISANTLARHTHSNKATLDKLTDAQLTKLDGIDPDLYLPKSGGVMSGHIDMATNSKDIAVGSHRSAVPELPTAVAGGTVSKKLSIETGLTERRSLIGSWLDENSVWHNILSVRHRNGWNDGPNYGFYLRSLLISNGSLFWNKQTGAGKWQGERVLLDSTNYSSYAAKSDHTHAMITNSAVWIAGANNAVKWYRLGVLVSSGNFSNAVIRVWSGDGANGRANQNSFFEIQIKDGWQSTESAAKACGVTVYRTHCDKVKVKVIPTAHDTYTVWAYLPWTYWNGNYAVYGKYKSWTSQQLIQSDEPEGTGADTAYYDQAFLTSTVAKATEATAITETAWKAVPATGAAETVGRSIKYLKSGNTVFVQGSISFSASLNTPVCGKMPSDCLPNQKLVFTGWDIIGAPASFAIILDTDGKLSFLSPGTTAYWFKDHRTYSFNFSYHIN